MPFRGTYLPGGAASRHEARAAAREGRTPNFAEASATPAETPDVAGAPAGADDDHAEDQAEDTIQADEEE